MNDDKFKENERILFSLVAARNESIVEQILQDSFFNNIVWKPLGGSNNNYATVTNQQSNPINALCEKPINSIDHVLLKKSKIAGDDPEGESSPNSMKEAVQKYLKIPEGDFDNLTSEEIKDLAKNIMIVADGSKDPPNIIIADRGEGQKPEDFEKTLLSLQQGNKKKIKFVQGKYNMGGTGVLPFCGTKGYQLILSRKSIELAGNDSEWGFTLVREKPDVPNEYKTTWYEYFTDSENQILRLTAKALKILPKGEELVDGCFIKLFNYELPNPSVITSKLWADLSTKLYSPAIPITMFENRLDFNMSLDNDLRFRILYGNKFRIKKDAKKYIYKNFSIHSRLNDFGTNKINITVFKHASMIKKKLNKTKEFRRENEAVLLTQNGQTHATISQIKFKTRTNLIALASYVMLHIDLTNIPPAKSKMFLASRDRARQSADYKNLVKRIFDDVADDDQLKALNEEFKKLDDESTVKDSSMEDVISKIIRKNPTFMDLLDPGVLHVENKPTTFAKKAFAPKHIPTFLKIRGIKENLTNEKQIPFTGNSAHIYFQTDAPDDYTEREQDQGELIIQWPESLDGSYSGPYSGDIHVKLNGKGIKGDKIGDLNVILTRPNMEPLKNTVSLYFDEPKKGPPKGPRKEKNSGVSMPKFHWITKDDWSVWGWDEFAVATADLENIRINRNCQYLEDFKKNRPSEDASKITAGFGLHIYFTSMVMHHELKDDENSEAIFKKAITAVGKSCLPITYDFGEESIEMITKLESHNIESDYV